MNKRQFNFCVRKAFRAALAGSMMILSGCGASDTAQPSIEPASEPSEPSDLYASLYLVGNACISEELSEDAGGDFHPMFEEIRKESEGYDLKYYNQDTLVGEDGAQAAAEALIDDGFNLVSLANNDAMNAGEEGVQNSMNFWNAHPEAVTAGTYTNQQDQKEISVHEVNGITYAFLSWTYGTDEAVPEGKEYLVNIYKGREEELLEQVKEAKSKADLVIVAMHWGIENRLTPGYDDDITQMDFANQLSNAGADIIIGTHPYVIEAAAWINGNRTICFYSLGNLISSLPAGMPMTGIENGTGTVADERGAWVGMEAGLTIHKSIKNDETKVEITDVKTDLIYSYRDENNQNFKVIPFSSLTYEEEPDKDEIYDAYKQYITMYDPTITVGMH